MSSSILAGSARLAARQIARHAPLSRPQLSAAVSAVRIAAVSPSSSKFITHHTADSSIISSFRRAYATESGPSPSPKQSAPSSSKFKLFGLYLWRLTYGSAILGVAYVGYALYDSRHPYDQMPPDPSKKTLVVLGSGWGAVSLLKKLDTENYNVIVVSPRNFFLFTPLLPSCTTGTIENRSIMEPLRHILRHKKASVTFYEAECTSIDPVNRTLLLRDNSEIKGETYETSLPFDYLVIGVGAQNTTFGIPGVQENACFLKEIQDAQKIRTRIMDCIETATFKDQSPEERKRLLHFVVVGGGPTGIEFAGELQDFFEEDLRKWVPEIGSDFKVSLIEALPNVLPMFSKELISYTERSFQDQKIDIKSKTMVKKVTDKAIFAEATNADGTKSMIELPYGLLVWATGNAPRPVVRDLMSKIPEQAKSRRGLEVNDYMVVNGTEGIWAVGDCAATSYAPTAQVATQQGAYLARLLNSLAKTNALEEKVLELEDLVAATSSLDDKKAITVEIENKEKSLRRTKTIGPFQYTHQGALAYIGSDKAIADFAFADGRKVASSGELTFLFWRSAYVSMVFSTRNKMLVVFDWIKVKMFGRDVSRE
ncbi:pyridine nucleotide-disulfide oxidoreductase-domain-containing protein [Lipomyces oligophaga]|uniref:pyridine nucleotide-disulfide oxidoreductase-domain-containing protein n=1 Tax=Lipomyces oligophaga TaxID=45792 RepID=UPI0034CF20DE